VFETTVQRCITEGLVGRAGFAVDASMIKADANRQRGVPGGAGLPPEAANHAVHGYLAVLDDAAFGATTPVVPKFVSPADPGLALDGCKRRARFFRLLHQLPDRPEARRHYGCGGDHRSPTGRGHGTAPDDRPYTGTLGL
jgi:hypothetical protein